MSVPIELKSRGEYERVIRPLLPPGAFAPDDRHLLRIGFHLLIVLSGLLAVRAVSTWWMMLPMAALIGHSLACLAFLAHDVSHNSVVTNRAAKRGLKLLLWGLNAMPPTFWHRLHNQTHHVETNTLHDSDRIYRKCESTFAIRLYLLTFFPNCRTPLRHPMMLLHFVTYIARHVCAALLPGGLKPSVVTFKPRYTVKQRLAIVGEVALIGVLQLGIWALMRGDWLRYAFVGVIPLLVASCVTMAYIWTNHTLNPLCNETDPLIGSTSVIVPRWLDWLHDNFSYHTEHHVFPSMNPRHYPEVSRLLQQHFPDRYNRIPFCQAWRKIWQLDEFIREPQSTQRGMA